MCNPNVPDRIDVNDEQNVAYWAQQLGISTVEVRLVVLKAGPAVAAVRKLLNELDWPKHKEKDSEENWGGKDQIHS